MVAYVRYAACYYRFVIVFVVIVSLPPRSQFNDGVPSLPLSSAIFAALFLLVNIALPTSSLTQHFILVHLCIVILLLFLILIILPVAPMTHPVVDSFIIVVVSVVMFGWPCLLVFVTIILSFSFSIALCLFLCRRQTLTLPSPLLLAFFFLLPLPSLKAFYHPSVLFLQIRAVLFDSSLPRVDIRLACVSPQQHVPWLLSAELSADLQYHLWAVVP